MVLIIEEGCSEFISGLLNYSIACLHQRYWTLTRLVAQVRSHIITSAFPVEPRETTVIRNITEILRGISTFPFLPRVSNYLPLCLTPCVYNVQYRLQSAIRFDHLFLFSSLVAIVISQRVSILMILAMLPREIYWWC